MSLSALSGRFLSGSRRRTHTFQLNITDSTQQTHEEQKLYVLNAHVHTSVAGEAIKERVPG